MFDRFCYCWLGGSAPIPKNKPEEAMTLIARRAKRLTATYRDVVVDMLASFAGVR
jgi:hypothetical protein